MSDIIGDIIKNINSGGGNSNTSSIDQTALAIEQERTRQKTIESALNQKDTTKTAIIIISVLFVFGIVGFVLYKNLK